MKKFRIFLAMALCLSLLTFAGCGNTDNTDTMDDGTVTEDTTDRTDNGTDNDGMDNNKDNTNQNNDNAVNNDNGNDNSDGTIGEDLADGARKAVDDVENAVDGNDTVRNNNR